MIQALQKMCANSALLLVVFSIGCTQHVIPKKVRSELFNTQADELVLLQELTVAAPVENVWAAYTTSEGWMKWASPVAEIDLRAGGTIKTHYTPSAKIGDAGTITLNIVNYVPQRVLTLRAEMTERWPEVMKMDDGKLMNVIVFDPLSEQATRIQSYGVGYRDVDAYRKMMSFFISANEKLLMKLKSELEAEALSAN